MKRVLGRSQIEVSAMGLGCWAIGGPFLLDGKADGWGTIDDTESIRAIHHAVDLGVTFFDTADVYGTGHSESILGQALKARRHSVIIATKCGYSYDSAQRSITGTNVTPQYIRRACEASLQRLQTDYIDLYQLHVGDTSWQEAEGVWETFEQLKQQGLIRAYGWSTNAVDQARLFATQTNGTTLQHPANVLLDVSAMFALSEEYNLASICNAPLAMGFLSGKFHATSQLPADDVRGSGHGWVSYFRDGKPRQEFLDQLSAIREIMSSGGRTLVQGALAWLWARSEYSIPIPGFKSIQQVEENAHALRFGPLTAEQMQAIDHMLIQTDQ